MEINSGYLPVDWIDGNFFFNLKACEVLWKKKHDESGVSGKDRRLSASRRAVPTTEALSKTIIFYCIIEYKLAVASIIITCIVYFVKPIRL